MLGVGLVGEAETGDEDTGCLFELWLPHQLEHELPELGDGC
jgi:hypothetical protein